MLNTGLVVQLGKMLTGSAVGVNDFADKLHNWYSTIVFMLLASVLGLRQYVMKPISYAIPLFCESFHKVFGLCNFARQKTPTTKDPTTKDPTTKAPRQKTPRQNPPATEDPTDKIHQI